MRAMASLSRLDLLAIVVADGVFGTKQFSQRALAALAGHDEHLLRVGVFARFDIDDGRERQVTHRRLAGVDDLMRHLGTAGWACDHVVPADRVALVAEAQLALSLQDEEHLLLAMMAVERALRLAG